MIACCVIYDTILAGASNFVVIMLEVMVLPAAMHNFKYLIIFILIYKCCASPYTLNVEM